MQLPPTDEIVMVAGTPPIRAKKARYYEDARFKERILPPPALAAPKIARPDDWTALPLPPGPQIAEGTAAAPEEAVQAALDRLMQGRTTFVIAHRLSTIRDADLIVVMEDGHIAEQGTHESLLAAEGAYARLYRSQFAAAAARAD